MNSITELSNKIPDYMVGSYYWVNITHINNPDSFYARPTHLTNYLPDLQSKGYKIDKTELRVLDVVVYKSKKLKSYVRGQVIFIYSSSEAECCDINILDHGGFEKCIQLDKLYKSQYSDVPALATHCQLADCKPLGDKWTEKEIEAMKFYIGHERAKMIIKGKSAEALIVELINTCPDDTATMLALTGYSAFGYGSNAVNRFSSLAPTRQYFRHREINIDDVIHVRVQSGNDLKCFFVAPVKEYKQYLNERDNITYFSLKQNNLSLEELKEDMPVCCYIDFNKKYERAVVKEIGKNKVKVQLIDWGKNIETDVSRLKRCEKFFHIPALAICCSADEEQIWDNGLNKFLYPGYEFLITIKVLGNQFEIPNIVLISPLK